MEYFVNLIKVESFLKVLLEWKTLIEDHPHKETQGNLNLFLKIYNHNRP